MYIQELRSPMQPPVPVVARPPSGAMTTNTGKTKGDPRLAWGGHGPERRHAADFTVLDRALIRYVTGEDVDATPDDDLGPFAMQILTDRRSHRLPAGQEIDLAYLSRTHLRLAPLGPRTPFTDPLFRRAVEFVQSRSNGRLDLAL